MKKLIGIGMILVLAWLAATQAQAQVVASRGSPALALARICVSEAGWDCFTSGDGYAIHEVLLRGSIREDMDYVSFARAYSRRAMGVAEATNRPWIAHLTESGTAPEGWPRYVTRCHGRGAARTCDVRPHPPWSAYRARWLALLDRAREVVRFTLDDWDEWGFCDGEVHDWGGSMDRERAVRIGLLEVECGDTANDFYARPALLPVEVPLPNGVDPD